MPSTLPLRADLVNYSMRLSLDAKNFDLDFVYNQRDGRYYMAVYDSISPINSDGSRDAIISSQPVLIGEPLLAICRDRARPLGDLVAVDTLDPGQDPELGALGGRVIMAYLTRDELAALGTAAYPYLLPAGPQ